MGRDGGRREECLGLRGLRRITTGGPRAFSVQRPAPRRTGLRALHAKAGRPRQGGRALRVVVLREAFVFDARAGPGGRLRRGARPPAQRLAEGVPGAHRRFPSGARFGLGAPHHPGLARRAFDGCFRRTRRPPLPLRRARPRAQLLGAERLGFVCLRGPRPAEGVEEERGRRRDAGAGRDGRRGAARARPEGLRAPDGPRGPAGGLRRGARVQRRGGAAPDLPLRGARGARGLLLRLLPASLALPSLRRRNALRECRGDGVWVAPDAIDATSIPEHAIAACREHEPRPQAGTCTRSSCSWP